MKLTVSAHITKQKEVLVNLRKYRNLKSCLDHINNPESNIDGDVWLGEIGDFSPTESIGIPFSVLRKSIRKYLEKEVAFLEETLKKEGIEML